MELVRKASVIVIAGAILCALISNMYSNSLLEKEKQRISNLSSYSQMYFENS